MSNRFSHLISYVVMVMPTCRPYQTLTTASFRGLSTEDRDNNQKCQLEFFISSFAIAKLLPSPAKFRATIPNQGPFSLAKEIYVTRRLFLIPQQVRGLL